MKTVTGQAAGLEILELAEKIIHVCDEHTSSRVVSCTAISVAEKIMASRQFAGEQLVYEPTLEQSSVRP